MTDPGALDALPVTGSGSLAALADQAPVALVHLDASMRFTGANPAAESLLGLSLNQMVGHKPGETIVDCEGLLALLEFALRTQGDVSAPDVAIRTQLYQPSLRLTVRIRFVPGDGLVVALSEPMGYEREDGVPGVAGMGRMLGHEVKNPLAGISGAAQLLLRRSEGDDRELLELICDETRRIERLINRFSAFELFSRPQLGPINIHEVLDRVVNAEAAAFGARVAYRRVYDPSLPDIPADSDHLHEALLNVLRNGAEAAILRHGDGGGARIDVVTAFEMRAPITSRGRVTSKRAIRIDIIDNGPGIDPAKAPALFEAFESSKASGRGLGLTVVKEVIAAHAGHVAFSDHSGGTCVSLFLPIKRKAQGHE